MNNLKEKIKNALNKCDVVILSGSYGVGKTRMLTELIDDFIETEDRYLSANALINNSSYSVIKHILKTKDFFVIDDVSSKQLQATINRIQEAVAKTNKKCKVVIATDSYCKDKVNSVILRIKHFHISKTRAFLPKINFEINDCKTENEKLIKENFSLNLKVDELHLSLSHLLDKIGIYKNTVAAYENEIILLQKANSDLESYLNEEVHCLKEELNNEAEETGFYKEMSEDLLTEVRWLKNSIEVYRGEIDESTIRRVEYTVQQLRESFGDDYEV